MEKRRALSLVLIATTAVDPTQEDVARVVRGGTGPGSDIALEASGSYRGLQDALWTAGQGGTVITLDGTDDQLTLGREWMHNRLTLISCMADWGNPSRDYPRWTRPRLDETVRELLLRERLEAESVVQPVVRLEKAAGTIELAYRDASWSVKIGVELRG